MPSPDPLETISTPDLEAMRARAWREAARCWQEYRAAAGARSERAALLAGARSAQDHWQHLHDECDRRMKR